MIDYIVKEYTVKNISKNKTVEKCNYIWKPGETKTVKLNSNGVFQIKANMYLTFIKQEKDLKPEKVEITKKDTPDVLVCPKCGKTYKDEKYYNIHIEKCQAGGEE